MLRLLLTVLTILSRQENELKAIEFTHGMRVLYVPNHACGSQSHPDCEEGTVSSANDKYVFVRFDKQVKKFGWHGTTSQACDTDNLRLIP